VVLAFLSSIFIVFIKSDTRVQTKLNQASKPQSMHILSDQSNSKNLSIFIHDIKPEVQEKPELTKTELFIAENQDQENKEDYFDRLGVIKKRLLGIFMACCAGVFYGECFTPVIYIAEQDGNTPYINYTFSYYTGILAASTVYLLIYCAVKRNRPVIHTNLVLPGFACGVLWAAGNLCQTVGTSLLSQAVSFPIANSGPSIVATMWAVFLFKEIKGTQNYVLLALGFIVAIVASILSAFSF
jgi:hypothetical protein